MGNVEPRGGSSFETHGHTPRFTDADIARELGVSVGEFRDMDAFERARLTLELRTGSADDHHKRQILDVLQTGVDRADQHLDRHRDHQRRAPRINLWTGVALSAFTIAFSAGATWLVGERQSSTPVAGAALPEPEVIRPAATVAIEDLPALEPPAPRACDRTIEVEAGATYRAVAYQQIVNWYSLIGVLPEDLDADIGVYEGLLRQANRDLPLVAGMTMIVPPVIDPPDC